MTIAEAKNKLIAWAKGQVGYPEGANNWNKYAEGLQPAYGWNVQNQPWCDVFTDACFITCFGLQNAAKMTYQTVGSFSALCRQSAQYFKDNGAFYSYPEPGDIIFLLYEGGINHQGIVTDVTGGVVYTVEGNSSDRVRPGAYATGSSNIAGYGRPKWSIVAGNSSIPATTGGNTNQSENPTSSTPAAPAEPDHSYCDYTYNVAVSLLKMGNHGPQVMHMQQLLAVNGFDPGDIDGEFGPATAAALRDFQSAVGIGVDGEFGGESFAALWNYQS